MPGPSSPGPGAPSSAQLRGVLFFRTRCREDVFPWGGSKSGGGWDGGEKGRWKPRAVRAWRGKRWAEWAPRSGAQGPSTGSEPAAPLQSHLQPLALALKQNLPREARRSTWSRNEAWFGGAGLGQPSPSVSRPTSAVKAKVKAKVREATGRAPSAVLVHLVNNASFLLLPNGRGSSAHRTRSVRRRDRRPPRASRRSAETQAPYLWNDKIKAKPVGSSASCSPHFQARGAPGQGRGGGQRGREEAATIPQTGAPRILSLGPRVGWERWTPEQRQRLRTKTPPQPRLSPVTEEWECPQHVLRSLRSLGGCCALWGQAGSEEGRRQAVTRSSVFV